MPPYFLYHVLPARWADWCCERPEHLAAVFSALALVLSVASLARA
jgi:hypothetical protein